MRRHALRGLWPADAAASALALAGGAWAAQPLPSVSRLESHGPLLALPFVSPPPRLHRTMKWAHSSGKRQLAMRFTSTQDHAVVGLERPADARAVASAYGVTVVAVDAGLHMMEVQAAPAALDRLAHAASWDSRLRFVEPLVARQYQHLRNDPALLQIDPVTNQPYEWNFTATHADLALNLSKGSPTILVGVIDTGVSEVPDLKGKIAETWFFNDQVASSDDTDGHGTAVSSLIAATADDGVGIAGFGGAARIDMYRDVQLNGFSDAVAIHRLVDRGVRIINMSFGGGTLSTPELDALNYASDAGVLLVAATGNNGSAQSIWPARQVQAAGGVPGPGLAVGASTDTGVRVNFSNYGDNLSLLAPGAFADNDCKNGIYLPLPPVAWLFDGNQCIRFFTDPDNTRHAYLRGTSFAAPEVAGAAALLWAARPSLKSYEVVTLLQHGSTQSDGTGWNPNDGWGVLDVAKSLELATGQSAADRIALGAATGPATVGAGRKLTETAAVNWGDGTAVSAATVACAATVRGKTVEPLFEGFVNGQATCTWQTPASGGGRTLTGTITVTEPQTGLSATQPFTLALGDVTRPKVQAEASTGRWGTNVPLHFVANEATGAVSVKVRVLRGSAVVAISSGHAASGAAASIGWKAPSAPTTHAFHFCVTATDTAGNVSAPSCAPIRLS
ncbi:MAG: serine protease [Gaiellaceae bacterium]|nr:serine protease [Gaiellaceae bacterium]